MRVTLMLFTMLVPLLSFSAGSPTNDRVIRLAVPTSVEDSGLLHHLLPKFLDRYAYDLEPTVVGSGTALRMGRFGAVDVLWVHSPEAEKKFLDEGYALDRQTFMRNDFILAGPEADPGQIAAADNIVQAFQAIFNARQPFISRGDDSGTNKKELSIWKQAGIDPYGSDWYIETGTGMAASLEVAEQNNAYILVDRATFLVRHREGFEIILQDPEHLSNPYSSITVDAKTHTGVNLEGAQTLNRWITSEAGQKAIASYTHNGVQLYQPTCPTCPRAE
jgi:tungstate transport system substrate-binding protein